MSTYTSSLGLELITPGSQAGLWGNTTNNTFTLIDQAITGVTPISFASASGSTYTLTDFNGAEDESRSAVLNITGSASGANTVVIPNKQKTYLVRNNTGQDVTFQTPSPTASYTVGAGYSILIFCDGNNNVFTGIASPGVGTLSVNAGGTGATTFTAGFIKSTGGTNALTSSSTVNAASEISGTLPVANGGTGNTSLTSGALLVGNGTGSVATLSGGVVGYVPTWNGSTWVAAAPAGASGVTSFSAGSTGLLPSSASTGVVTLSGTLNVANGGTGATSAAAARTSLGLGTIATASSTDYIASTGAQSVSGLKTWTVSDASTYGVLVSGGGYNGGIRPGGVQFGGTDTGFSFAAGSPSAIACVINNGNTFITYSNGNFSIQGSVAVKTSGSTWDNPSDSRLKDNVQAYTKGLNELVQINPKTWTFNGKGGSKAGVRSVGVIADEAMKVIPDSVTTYKAKLNSEDATESDIKKFSADEIIWMLVNSVKTLKAEVDALKAAK